MSCCYDLVTSRKFRVQNSFWAPTGQTFINPWNKDGWGRKVQFVIRSYFFRQRVPPNSQPQPLFAKLKYITRCHKWPTLKANLKKNPHSPSITLPPALFFSFVVLPSGFSSYESVLISHTSRSQFLIYFITLKLPLFFSPFPVTRIATSSPTAITWWVVSLFRIRLETWGHSITSQMPMDFRHRYKTQPVNSAGVSPSDYVGRCNTWWKPWRILLVLLLFTIANFVIINIIL